MGQIRMLMEATGLRQHVDRIERNLVRMLVLGVVAFLCGIVALVFVAMATYAALRPDFGEVQAALIAAGIFIAVAAVCGLLLSRKPRPEPRVVERVVETEVETPPIAAAGERPFPAEATSPAALLPNLRAESLWDIATIVAVGVVMGMSNKRKPADD